MQSCACRLPTEQCRPPEAAKFWLPFSCPLDHVLQVEHLADSPEQYGPPITVRERGFLANPRVPKPIKVSRIKVV